MSLYKFKNRLNWFNLNFMASHEQVNQTISRMTIYKNCLFLILCGLVSLEAQNVRNDTLLQDGWKFHLYDPNSQDLCPSDAFTPFNSMSCTTWARKAAYGETVDSCRSYCCGDPQCGGWVFQTDGFAACLISNGENTGACSSAGDDWIGGIRSVPAAPVLPPQDGPQTANYDDSAWREVSIPHDYIIEQTPSPDAEMSHGFRPKNISWYRLHFDLPAEYADHSTWLEFEGVFRATDVWLNGQFLGHHSSGYTGFRLPITKQQGGVFGGENVLAVRVDPFADEGWW